MNYPVTVWMAIPFGLLLVLIALAPLFFADWWSKHYIKVVLALSVITIGYYCKLGAMERLAETAHEYASFIIFIGSLFVVAGGIHITVKGEATPFINVVFLLIGAIAANLLGTTGASMLLIRPWIRMNKYRITGYHIVFFIFIVSNVGGCLTPIGDPPLFLGYLAGVPFWWVTKKCLGAWFVGVGMLLVMFYFLDVKNYRRAARNVREKMTEHEQWRFDGLGNIFFLGIILAAVFIQNIPFLREGLMLLAAVASYFTTAKSVHDSNNFNFHPIKEVAILFVGIFATMIPALDWLAGNAGKLGGASASFFYFGSGILSSVLDNAPTYLGFLSALFGVAGTKDIHILLDQHPLAIMAISVGSVFFGANTYIGNGPNFMVKAIADHSKVHTPTFLDYVFKYTFPFMLPMLLVVWALFFRG